MAWLKTVLRDYSGVLEDWLLDESDDRDIDTLIQDYIDSNAPSS